MALQRLVVGHLVAGIAKYSTTFNWKCKFPLVLLNSNNNNNYCTGYLTDLEELDGIYANPVVHTTIPGPQSEVIIHTI